MRRIVRDALADEVTDGYSDLADVCGGGGGLLALLNELFPQRYGVIDKSGKWIVRAIRDGIENNETAVHGGRFYFPEKRLWGVMDERGGWIARPQFDDFASYEGVALQLAGVQMSGAWGFIDRNGELKIPPKFDLVKEFNNELRTAMSRNYWGCIDKSGAWVIEPLFADINIVGEAGAQIAASDGECWGFDSQGNWTIDHQFDRWFDLCGLDSQGLIKARKNELWGFIDSNGEWAIRR